MSEQSAAIPATEENDQTTWDISKRDRLMDLGFRVDMDKTGFLAVEIMKDGSDGRMIPENGKRVLTVDELLPLLRRDPVREDEIIHGVPLPGYLRPAAFISRAFSFAI